MLARLWSPTFKANRVVRPVFRFRPGLNTVEGADGAQNSSGKSTVFQMIDFIYGGKDFLRSEAAALPQAMSHHMILYTLRINGTDHHFSRDTSRPSFVTAYSDADWKLPVNDRNLDDYMDFLLTSYGLDEQGTTWRELVGWFSRDDESDLALLDKPLTAAACEPDMGDAVALLRLFSAYDEVENIQARYETVRTEVSALDAMAKGSYSNYTNSRQLPNASPTLSTTTAIKDVGRSPRTSFSSTWPYREAFSCRFHPRLSAHQDHHVRTRDPASRSLRQYSKLD